MCGGEKEVYTGFWWGYLREGEHFEDPGIDGRIILKYSFKNWDRGMDWIDVAYDTDRWRTCRVVMNRRVS
jgi:hypothetical protein